MGFFEDAFALMAPADFNTKTSNTKPMAPKKTETHIGYNCFEGIKQFIPQSIVGTGSLCVHIKGLLSSL